jgi:hypothetical protein
MTIRRGFSPLPHVLTLADTGDRCTQLEISEDKPTFGKADRWQLQIGLARLMPYGLRSAAHYANA